MRILSEPAEAADPRCLRVEANFGWEAISGLRTVNLRPTKRRKFYIPAWAPDHGNKSGLGTLPEEENYREQSSLL